MSTGSQPKGPTIAKHCPQCGAVVRNDARRCWLCYADMPESTAAAGEPAGHPGSFSLSSLMMFVTLVCVVLGVSSLWPGLAVPLGVVALVVWLRTVHQVRQRARLGETLSTMQKIQMFLSSFGVTLVVLGLVVVTGFAALVSVCATFLSVGMAEAVPYAIVGALVFVVGIVGLRAIFKSINRRAE